eukprot:m.133242 g.133242  ORF g.133242 m.133242 type:complete len:52 (+) comp15945_c0_seq1:1-156(+)
MNVKAWVKFYSQFEEDLSACIARDVKQQIEMTYRSLACGLRHWLWAPGVEY